MRHGGKKWSGSHMFRFNSLSILFFFQREMERFENARGKSRRMRTPPLSFLSSSSKRRRRQRRRRRRSWCATACVPWVRRKKGGIEHSPDAFSPKNSHIWNITKKKQKYLRSNEQKETKNTRKREKELSFFFNAFSYISLLCLTRLLFLHTHYFTRAFTLTLLFKYTHHTFIKKCCSLPRRTSLNRFYYGGASFCSATVGDDDPAERVAS